VSAYWYNPNIHPFKEHELRLEAMKTFAVVTNTSLIVEEGYDIIKYFRTIVGHERDRCIDCYRMRMTKTAEVGGQKGFDYFTTTLLISPYQNHEIIIGLGEELGMALNTSFYYEDFRTGFRESHRISREMGLYHQGYCGCVYSEWERYGKVRI